MSFLDSKPSASFLLYMDKIQTPHHSSRRPSLFSFLSLLFFPFDHLVLVTLVLFLEHNVPSTSMPLHLVYPLPEMFLLQISVWLIPFVKI